MFKFLFGGNDDDDEIEIGKSEEYDNEDNEGKTIIRQGRLKILSTQVVYDYDESTFYTLATCINEKNQLETISIEDFHIDENVTSLSGAFIDYEKYLEDEEEYAIGKIYMKKEL